MSDKEFDIYENDEKNNANAGGNVDIVNDASEYNDGFVEEIYAETAPLKKNKGGLKGRNFKQGLYSSFVALFVVAIVILFNLFVGQLNLKVDLTKEEVYTLTDATRELAENLTDEIEIYYLVKEGEEYDVLKNVVEQYDKLPNITSIWKDPELYPQFAAQYTSEQLQGNRSEERRVGKECL